MSQPRDDVEASARLVSKQEDHGFARENLNFNDADDTYPSWRNWRSWSNPGPGNWRSGSIWSRCVPPYTSQLWRRIQSIPLPSWLPVRKLSQPNARYLVFAVVVFFVLTSLTLHTTSGNIIPQVQVGTTNPPAQPAESPEEAQPAEPPEPEFCTTWPVDDLGNYDVYAHDHTNRAKLTSIAPRTGWHKPEGLRVVAMVFFGRRRYVDILDCYLQQNLASNGGYLDEVWFMANTGNEDDLAWLDGLVNKTEAYQVVGLEDCNKYDRSYRCLWEYAVDDNTIFVKLDDDIIYIHQDAIPQLVHTRLAVPHAFGVSAQLVNSPITGVEQYHHGAIYPFVPDPKKRPRHHASETWRLSKLDRFPAGKLDSLRDRDDHAIMFPEVPYTGHPFVLLSEDNADLPHTSMGRYDQHPGPEFIAFSDVWKSWAMAAQQQYSLLYNLEKDQISRYFFGKPALYPPDAKGPDRSITVAAPKQEGQPVLGGEQIFDTQFRRYNLNFCAVWGADIKEHLPMDDDDEDAITHRIPKKTGRPFIIDTRAIVGHFSFFTQVQEIRRTDLLDRWRAFANEAVCKPDNLKRPWDLRCPKFRD